MSHPPRLFPALALALLAVLGPAPDAALAEQKPIVVYIKGKTLRYDQEVGAELKEVFLESWDCATGALSKKETIEAYFHLSEDKEVITPDLICDACRTKFQIDKKADKYYFGGVRAKAATMAEANKAAPAPAPGEGVRALEEKVKQISQQLVKVGFAAGTGPARTRIVTSEFTSSLESFGTPELDKIAGYVMNDASLDHDARYNVLRTFGFTFYDRKDFPKAIFFCDKCIALDDRPYSAHFMKGASLEGQGEGRKAVRAYAKGLGTAGTRQGIARSIEGLEKLLGGASSGLSADEVAAIKPRLEALKQLDLETPKAHEDAHALAEDIERLVKP